MTFFALDDVMEEKEWGNIHRAVRTMVCALTTTLSSLHNVVARLARYDVSMLPTFTSPFCASNSHPLHSPL